MQNLAETSPASIRNVDFFTQVLPGFYRRKMAWNCPSHQKKGIAEICNLFNQFRMTPLKKSIRGGHVVIAAHFIALLILVSTCEFIKSENKLSGVVNAQGEAFAGSETCGKCHQVLADSHSVTPHFLTSRPGTIETVKGSFDSGKNVFIMNERLKVVMEKSSAGLFQHAFVAGSEVDRKPIDITLGSGRQGQTYLFWQDNVLFQLPVSYHSPSHSWSNSPGYPTDQILFNRSISARCLECHATYFKSGMPTDGKIGRAHV